MMLTLNSAEERKREVSFFCDFIGLLIKLRVCLGSGLPI